MKSGKNNHHCIVGAASWINGWPLLLATSLHLLAQADSSRTDYRNEVFDPALTSQQWTTLTQALSVAFYSGNIGDAPGSPNAFSSAKTNSPTDGAVYLTQSIIGQPVGVTTVPFNLSVSGSGTVTPAPDAYTWANWYQLGQTVTLTAQPGRYYVFAGWSDGNLANPRTVVAVPSNSYVAVFTNTLALETNAFSRVVPFGTPLVLLDGQYYSNNVVPAANGTVFTLLITNSFPSGTNYYSVNNAAYVPYTGPVPVTAPFSIRARGYSQDGLTSQDADRVNSISVNTPGGGTIAVTSQTDFYTGANSVTLTASGESGWSFLNWTNDADGGDNPKALVMTNSRTVQAVFGAPVVTTGTALHGTIRREPDLTLYPYGSTVRLSAMPDAGYYFDSWNGALNGRTDTPVDFIVTNASPVSTNTAKFFELGVNMYSLTLLKSGYGTVTVTPAGWSYASGTLVTLSNNPAPGQSFIGWSGDANNTNNPITVSMTASKTITANFAVTQPLFVLSADSYEVSESAGALVVPVLNLGVLGGSVTLSTLDATAVAGSDYTTNYTAITSLSGPSTNYVSIPIRQQWLNGPDKTFQVSLSGATTNLGSPSAALVSIHYDAAPTTNGSSFAQAFPEPAPDRSGSLRVTLLPENIGGQWRFEWERGWRNGGILVTNLEQANYPLAFRQLPGYIVPELPLQAVFAHAPTTEVTNQYAGAGGGLGWLTVNLGPSVVTNSGWRLLGEPDWRAGGSTAANLAPGARLVEFKPVSGLSAPATREVEVFANQGTLISGYYLIVTPPPYDVALPTPLPDASVISAGLTNSPRLPYAFNGQLQSDVGYGSGVAVRDRVVLTAAHVVFNDTALSYVGQVNWFFQKHSGEMDPNPMPLSARGWYLASGYAAQRVYDLTNGYSPGVSSPQSRYWDVAALYFLSPAARGGYGGYLASDMPTNQWLGNPLPKMLVGYPVDGASAGYTNVVPGRMHAVAPNNYAFTLQNDQVYASGDFLSFPGNSGGPLCVLYTNNVFYPAGVYLGTLNGASVVHGIDSNVVNLITLAATLGDAGTNQTGGGVITITVAGGSGLLAYVQVNIGPPAALAAGAAWRLQGSTNWSTGTNDMVAVAGGASAILEFKSIPGWNLPTNATIALALGDRVLVPALYTRAAQLNVSPAEGLTASGYVGGPFTPPSLTYTLTNMGETSLDWEVSKTAEWLSLSSASGTLAAGHGAEITLSLNAQAASLVPGTYSNTITFANLSTGIGNTNFPVSLIVAAHPLAHLTSLNLLADGAVAITLEGPPGRVYAILGSANLLTPLTNWPEVLRLTNATGQITFTNPPPAVTPQYYRARQL